MDNKMKIWIFAIIGVFLLAGVAIFNLTEPQDVYVNYESHQSDLVPHGVLSPSIIWNNITLVDSTVYNEATNTCTGTRYGMNITITPCKALTISGKNIQHNVNFKWQGSQTQNVSWIFVYDGELESGGMDLWKNVSFTEMQNVSTNAWVNNYPINNVTAFVNLGTPVESSCQIGNGNNTQMYNVTRLYQNGTAYTNVICFTTATPNGAGSYLLSGNYWQWSMQQVSGYRFEWVDITDQIDYMGYGLLNDSRSYYKVQNSVFAPNQSYLTRWRYTPQDNATRGKWHIFGYDPENTVPEAILSDEYIYLDPSWIPSYNVGLKYYWGFNEPSGSIASDNVSAANFTLSGSVKTSSNCKLSNCLVLSQSDNATISRLDIGTANAFTWSAWVYMGGTAGAYNALFWNADNSGQPFADGEFASIWTGSPNGFEQRMGNSNGPDGTTMDLGSGVSKHVLFKMNSGGVLEYWLNGVNVYNSSSGFTFTNFANLRTNIGGDYLEGDGNLGSAVFDELAIWNRSLSTAEVLDLYNNGTGLFYAPDPTLDIDVSLVSPPNAFVTNNTNMTFNATALASGGDSLSNATIRVYNASNLVYSNVVSLSGTQANLSWNTDVAGSGEGQYLWTVEGRSANNLVDIPANRTFTIDFMPPVLTLNEAIPDQFVGSFPTTAYLNYTASDATLNSCFYTTSDNATQTIFTCNTTQAVNFSSGGQKTIFYSANDTIGTTTTQNVSFDIGTFSQAVNVNPIGEGQNATFTLELNKTGIGSLTSTGTLNYNGNSYASSSITTSANRTVIARNLVIPDGTGSPTGNNVTWNWTFGVQTVGNFSTANRTQTVYSVDIDDCSTYGTIILNMTLRDEGTRNVVNASAGSDIQIDLQISSQQNSTIYWTYSNTWDDDAEALVCVPNGLLNSSEYRIDFVAEYSATDHVVEFFYLDNGTLDNTQSFNSLTNKTISLYDLLTADSTTFLFSFLDEDSIEVPDSIVHVYRQYIGSGIFEEVERGKQDNNGETHIHLVEEDVIYFFIISLDGEILFTSTTYNAKCLSSPCSITLESGSEFSEFPTNWQLLGEGGGYAFTQNATTRQVSVVFATPDVSLMNLTVAKQDYTGGFTIIDTDTTSSTGGTLSVSVPQAAGNVTFYAILYQDGEYITNQIVDFSETASAYYSTTGNVMASILVIGLILMGAAEGLLLFLFAIIALILVSALALMKLGYYALVGLICAIAIIMWKLIKRGRQVQLV